MRALFLMLVSSTCMANWIAELDVPKANVQQPGVRGYLSKTNCELANPGQTCYDYTTKDLRTHKVVGGKLQEDATLKSVVDVELAAKALAKTNRDARRNRLKTGTVTIDNANSVPDLKQVLKDLVTDFNEYTGNK